MEDVWDIVVASQDWHPHTHISFSSHHKHPHARPFTTVRVPRDVLGEHVDIHQDDENSGSSNDRNGNTEDEDDLEGEDNLGLTDPRSGYKTTQGVDDGQVDLNLWPDHCVKNTRGAEIERDLRMALKPWHRAGKFALVRKGTRSNVEAFSAFSGKVVPVGSPEMDSALGMYMNGRTTTTTVTGTGSADEPEQEQEEEVGEDLAGFLIKLGVKKICVVGLATDFCVAQTALAAMNRESSPFTVYLYEPAVRGVGKASSDKALRVCADRGVKVLHTEQELRGAFAGMAM